MTQKELLAIVKAMNHARMAEYHIEVRRGNETEAKMLLHESMMLDRIEWLIEDEDRAKAIVEIYGDVMKEVKE